MSFRFTSFLVFIGLELCLASIHAAHADSRKIFKAEYSIPVDDDSLKSFSKFPISSYVVESKSDGTTILSFALPDDLSAGKDKLLTFQETERTAIKRILKSEFGTVQCSIPWPNSQCRVEFNRKVVPEHSDAVDHILQKYALGDGWVERLEVFGRFSTEPIGIVQVIGQQ